MIKYLFSDVDDTITSDGVLKVCALESLYRLKENNVKIILVSGGSAGQALTYISQWPIDAIITESGALAYYKEKNSIKTWINPSLDQKAYKENKHVLLTNKILENVKSSKLSLDNFTRLYDIAIDHSQTKPYISEDDIKKIVNIAKENNAFYAISSIHINIYFGKYNKNQAVKSFVPFYLNKSFEEINKESVYVGDSLNDEVLFKIFENSYGVKNIEKTLSKFTYPPKTIVSKTGGEGFSLVVDSVLKK